MPQFNGDDIAKTPALIAIVANTASRADSTIETDQDNYVAGKPIVVKVTLRLSLIHILVSPAESDYLSP